MAGAELALPGERSGRVIVGRAGLLVALMVLFFLSGASGLIYQTLWLRLLALVFGVTLYAASAVLASFMAGLALGSLLAGRLSDRVRSPLRAFGLVELGVGVAALATPLALDVAERAYVAIYPHLPQSFAALTATRFALAFAVLLLPTTLMGATLPLVLKSSLLRRSGLGAQVGLLYGTNTAGAILGTVLAGFVLIGGVGITAAFRLAVANNLLIGLVALLLAARMRGADERPVEASVAAIAPATALPARTRRLILLVFALSGFASLALEIVWFRVFALFIQVTTYAFTTMLATVLLGIAVGSWLATPLLRWRRDSLLLLAACELAIGLAALLSFSLLAESYRLFNWIEGVLGRGVPVTLLAAFLAIFPTTLLLGVAFPLGLRLWAAGEDAEAQSGERIGLFYALNLGGAILGALVAGFLLLPRLGSRGSLIALAAVGLGSGLLLLGQCPPVARRRALALGLAALLAFVAIAPTVPDPFAAALASRHARRASRRR
jgi:spermidine synthase